jgi:hypothetical protein
MSYAKRILVQLTADQDSALRSRLVTLGVPIAEQIRRAVNLMLFADAKPRRKSSTKSSAEHETILSGNKAHKIAQKIGKPLEELYERVPAQKQSGEQLLEGFLEIL